MKRQLLIYIIIILAYTSHAQESPLNSLCIELRSNTIQKDTEIGRNSIQMCFSKNNIVEIEEDFFHGKLIYTQNNRFLEIINYSSGDIMRVYNMFDTYCFDGVCASSYVELIFCAGNYILQDKTTFEDWAKDLSSNLKITKYDGLLVNYLSDIKKEKLLLHTDEYGSVKDHFILNKTINQYVLKKRGLTKNNSDNITTIKFNNWFKGELIFNYDKNLCQIKNKETKAMMRIFYDFNVFENGGGIEGTFISKILNANNILNDYPAYSNASVFIFVSGNFIIKKPVKMVDWINYKNIPEKITKVKGSLRKYLKVSEYSHKDKN